MQAPNWTDFHQCAVCCSKFDASDVLPISLSCSHTLCFRCLGKLKSRVCPYDKSTISPDAETLPPNTALLQLLGEKLESPPDLSTLKLSDIDLVLYRSSIEAIEGLAMFLQPLAEQGITVAIGYLTKPVLKKLVTVVNCQILEREGRARAMRAARSIADRTITELLVMHQNQQQIASLLWTAVRTRGCQFLGPVMQEAALKLIVKVLENGNSLARKNIVMFVVQRLQDEFPMASKTSVGHVVQLLYRASCFNVEKREEDSSLMQLKEEFRTYETLRREHDSQIIKMAMDTGLRISPEQWSTLLYGDHKHKSDMQSIIDKLISLGAASSGLSELIVAINRSQDPYKLSDKLIPHLEVLLKVDVNIDKSSELVGSWQMFSDTMVSLLATLNGFSTFMQIQSGRYRTGMCPYLSKPGGCPKGDHCTYAHTEEQRDHYRDLAKNSKTAKTRTEPFPKVSTGVRMGRYSGDHGPPKIDGSFYAGAGYDGYPTVPPGYATTAAAAAAAAAAAGGATVVTGLREQYAAPGFQGDSVVLQTAIPVDPTLQVLQATPTPSGGIYTTPVGATVVNYNPVAVGPSPSAPPPQPAQDWYKDQQKLTSAYIQTGSDGSYLPKQNGHPPQQQYAGYHGNPSLPAYPDRPVSGNLRPLDVDSLRRRHENIKRTYETSAHSLNHGMGGASTHTVGVVPNYSTSQQVAYEGQSAAAGRTYSQPVPPPSSKFSYQVNTPYPTNTAHPNTTSTTYPDNWAYSSDTHTPHSDDQTTSDTAYYHAPTTSSADPAYYHTPSTTDSAYYHAPSSFEEYPFATNASDIATTSSKNSMSSVSVSEERRNSRHSFSDYSDDLTSQMTKLDVGGGSGAPYKTYQTTEAGDYGSTTLGQSSSSLAYSAPPSVSAVSSEENSVAPPQTSSRYEVTSASSWYEGPPSSSSSRYSGTSGVLYDVTSSIHQSGYGSISSTPSSSGMTVTSGSGYPVVPTAISVAEQQLRERVRQLEQIVKQKDDTIEEQRSQLKYSGPQKLYQDPTLMSSGPASLYSSGSLPSPHHSGLLQHAVYGTPPSISPQATMQHVQYYSHTAVPGGVAAAGTAFYTPQPAPGFSSHRWSGPLNPPLAGGQYPSPPGSLPVQQTITPPGTHLVGVLHHSGPILMPAATPTPPPARQDLMSDQHLAAYLQVMEQNKAAAVASTTPYPGSHTYHHHGYASIHPGHSSQQTYYAPRQYHHKNTY